MAWTFSDRQLAHEARRVARIVSGLACLFAFVMLAVVVAGYFLASYQDVRNHALGNSAWIQGEVAAVVSRTAPSQSIDMASLENVLADARRYHLLQGTGEDRFVIFGNSGEQLAALGAQPSWPVFRAQAQLAAGGSKIGHVVVETSLRSTLVESGLAAIVGAILALGALVALRALPVHAFHRAMERLDKAQKARAEAESGLRAYVLELEKAKSALQKSTSRLQLALEAAAESSQSKSQFLASMSHELRTPLNAIIGFSEIMENRLFGPIGNQRYSEYVNLILGCGRHLLSLVNEILDLSKADAGRLELYDGEVDLALLVRDLMRTMQATADKAEVNLISAIPNHLPRLRADPQRLTQVLLNLISNAIKFNVVNGTVRIEAEYEPADGLRIAVSDSGIGIATENIPKALERFGQVEDSFTRRYQGTGLGLPISKKLVELHGGTLMIKSAVGEGTCVTVWLPPERVIDTEDGIDFEVALSREI